MADETDQYIAAAALVVREGKASTSFIQRKLGIGYNAAARLIERMEDAGIVSAANHVGKRDVVSAGAIESAIKGVTTAKGNDRDTITMTLADGSSVTSTTAEFYAAADEIARKGRDPMKPDPDFKKHNQTAYSVAADELRQFIERYEQLEAEKRDAADGQKEVMAEAKGRGYDTKALRKLVALRKRKPDEIAEEEAVLEMYKNALGM